VFMFIVPVKFTFDFFRSVGRNNLPSFKCKFEDILFSEEFLSNAH
jgi:hypothetical protein